jgi:hypothetical protein
LRCLLVEDSDQFVERVHELATLESATTRRLDREGEVDRPAVDIVPAALFITGASHFVPSIYFMTPAATFVFARNRESVRRAANDYARVGPAHVKGRPDSDAQKESAHSQWAQDEVTICVQNERYNSHAEYDETASAENAPEPVHDPGRRHRFVFPRELDHRWFDWLRSFTQAKISR